MRSLAIVAGLAMIALEAVAIADVIQAHHRQEMARQEEARELNRPRQPSDAELLRFWFGGGDAAALRSRACSRAKPNQR